MILGLPGLFIIDAINGVVRIAGDLSSDYQPFYELRVEAYDGGSPSRSSIATVRISVIDQNTQRPMFRQTLYQLQVLEGQSMGHGDISCVPLLAKALATLGERVITISCSEFMVPHLHAP